MKHQMKHHLWRAAALAAIPVALLVSGCRVDMGIAVDENSTVTSSASFTDDSLVSQMLGVSDCKTLLEQYGGSNFDESAMTLVDHSSAGKIDCTVSETKSWDDASEKGMTITKDGDNVQVQFKGGDISEKDLDVFNSLTGQSTEQVLDSFALTIRTPGSIVKAQPEGKIDGNAVTYSGKDFLTAMSQGVLVEGKAASESAALGSHSAGSSAMVWGLVSVAAIIVIALIVFLVVRSRKKKKAEPTPPPAPWPPAQAPMQADAQVPEQANMPHAQVPNPPDPPDPYGSRHPEGQ
ncbi:MAG: hypothetical protein SPI12_06565 [Actinomycetaceae bacterium]|nr:hypothetical protein [Actinomycetaceae bacterium]MDY6083501.1 hypothetical protein [Actinomycetaceae bacterium]